MDKTSIKNFAIWARNKLMADITYKAGLLGISEKGIKKPLPQSTSGVQFFDIGTKEPYSISGIEIKQREALITVIRSKEQQSDYLTAYNAVVEEVAYTWFNRLIAVRFMEVNDYLPAHIRVLSSESAGKDEPDLVTSPFDTDLDFTPQEKAYIMQLKQDSELDELFRMLFIKQCNTLNALLPNLFEKTSDYTELLLNVAFTDKDGVVYRLIHDIAEDDFNVSKEGQVEIIGWLYQYYNTEPKDEAFALLKKNVKITKERIPAATQLFTPDWIVRYMVENSLGRLWLEGHSNDTLKSEWKYYLDEAEQETVVQKQLTVLRKEYKNIKPEDIKVIDPCMGSGHILVYAFDVLMRIYESAGYSKRDAAKLILEKNIYGLDIDRRAYQLAYFSLMMKARQYNRRIFKDGVKPQIYYPIGFSDGEEYGSLVRVDKLELMPEQSTEQQMTLFDGSYDAKLNTWNFKRLLAQKYDVVVTNPPYMGGSGMNSKMSDFVKNNYPDSKSDTFAAFMERCSEFLAPRGFQSMITMESWMFLSSFEKLREKLFTTQTIINMVHMPYLGKGGTSLGINFGTAAFIISKSRIKDYAAQYDYICYYETDTEGIPFKFPTINERYKNATIESYSKIPGSPIAYWVSEQFITVFQSKLMKEYATVQEGLKTADNERFIRYWYEIDVNKSNIIERANVKWFKHTKGGEYRRWYGNCLDVLNYENDGYELRNFKAASLTGKNNYFKENITWTRITSGQSSFRYTESGSIPNMAGLAIYPQNDFLYILGYLNTKIASNCLRIMNPTLNYPPGTIASLPLGISETHRKSVERIATENIKLSKKDWDNFEISVDFNQHPLINSEKTIGVAFAKWEREAEERFDTLKANEEGLNRIFIDIYSLQDELLPEVEDKDVTVRKAELQREIRSLISYAVGCMFGRYSLDEEGLIYAGGEWDATKYRTFEADRDNIIPITDEEYFKDDIVGLFVAFVKKVYGAETLEENLDFIANALCNRGNTSREVIRNYFLNDFFNNHCKIYQKRPIYWLFDSGKADGFKALIYMHRYDENTIGNLRVDYLHKMQRIYEREIIRMQETIENSTNAREVSEAEKRKDKLTKQLKEAMEYDVKIAHLALARITIDLDDGVKVNYEKVQTGTDGKKLEVLAKI